MGDYTSDEEDFYMGGDERDPADNLDMNEDGGYNNKDGNEEYDEEDNQKGYRNEDSQPARPKSGEVFVGCLIITIGAVFLLLYLFS